MQVTQNANSSYSLEITLTIKNFMQFFLDAKNFFIENFSNKRIQTKNALSWYTTQPIPIIHCCT